MEDNLKIGKDRLATGNAERVSLAVEAAATYWPQTRKPGEARRILGLAQAHWQSAAARAFS
jgi:uncharacterized protein (DUF849 family)